MKATDIASFVLMRILIFVRKLGNEIHDFCDVLDTKEVNGSNCIMDADIGY